MAWFFRKSMSVGGLFRVTASKGGLGVSAGVRGARVSVSPRGQVTGSATAGGVGVQQRMGSKRGRRRGPAGVPVWMVAVGLLMIAVVFGAMISGMRSAPPVRQPAPVVATEPAPAPRAAPPASAPILPVLIKAEVAPAKPAPPPVASWVDKLVPSEEERRAAYARPDPTPTPAEARGSAGKVWVPPYTKKDGTRVEGYWRDR
jgi:hypothetical protein